jgi:hypothetical protein
MGVTGVPPLDSPAGPIDNFASVQHELGEGVAAAAWARGQAMTLDIAARLVASDEWKMRQHTPRTLLTPRERNSRQREQEVAILVARG